MFCIILLVHCSLFDCGSVTCLLALVRAARRVRVRGTYWERLRGSSLRQLWEPCRQDDHTFDITSIFALQVARSTAMLALSATVYHASLLPCQTSNHPVLANRCLAMSPLLLSPSYSVASCRWRMKFVPGRNMDILGYHNISYLFNAPYILGKGWKARPYAWWLVPLLPP